jgi:hypothetical protein
MKRNVIRVMLGLAVACAALLVLESQANAGLFGRGSCGSAGGRGQRDGCHRWGQSSCNNGCEEAAPCEERRTRRAKAVRARVTTRAVVSGTAVGGIIAARPRLQQRMQQLGRNGIVARRRTAEARQLPKP